MEYKTRKNSFHFLKLVNKKSVIFVTVGLVLIAVGVYALLPRFIVKSSFPEEVYSHNVIIGENNLPPDETRIKISENFIVPDDQPRMLTLPTIKAQGYIQKMGIDQNGQMGTPTNIHLAGWYIHSVKPGDEGLSIIDGHYGARYSNGIFYNLKSLEQGNTFSVQYGDLSDRTFRVVSVKEVSIPEAQTLLYERDETISSQLNLITCGGDFDKSADTYDKRVIVVAERI